jgi:protein-S-isoprenylcysteine O-methyltransferase Ste14
MTSARLKRVAQRLRVPLGFVLAPLFLLFARPSGATILAGAAIAALGLAMRAWASGHLRKMAELTTSGPYAHTRNPLYFGTFVMVVGAALAGGVWWLALAAGAAYLAVYVPVMLAEVDTMRALFPGAYDEWAAAVPLFVPRVTPWARERRGHSGRFDHGLYMRYREYRAALGLLAFLGVLAIKMVLAQ